MNRSYNYVFLLGRPGSGKSAVFRSITDKLKAEGIADEFLRIDDFPKLLELNAADTEHKRHKPMPDGGFLILDDSLWDDVLKEVNKDALKLKDSGKMVFLEFARDSYEHALKFFSKDVLSNALLIYVDCPFDVCWQRNVERVKRQQEQGIDAHLTSREEMEKTYLNDDFKTLAKDISEPHIILDNSTSDLEKLENNILSIMPKFKK